MSKCDGAPCVAPGISVLFINSLLSIGGQSGVTTSVRMDWAGFCCRREDVSCTKYKHGTPMFEASWAGSWGTWSGGCHGWGTATKRSSKSLLTHTTLILVAIQPRLLSEQEMELRGRSRETSPLPSQLPSLFIYISQADWIYLDVPAQWNFSFFS